MTAAISDDQVYFPVAGLEISEVPDGRVIYQSDTQRVHYLNPTALVVFELCADRLTVGAIATFLRDAYQLPAPAAAEVRSCIEALIKENVVRLWTP